MAVPYVLQIKEAVNNIHLTNLDGGLEDKTTHFTYLPSINTGLQELPVPVLAPLNINKSQNIVNIHVQNSAESQNNYLYQVIYPHQLTVQPVEKIKRGRRKKKIEESQEPKREPVKVLKPAPRTRSGRVVKFPKHMEKDFKKVEIKETKKNAPILETDAEIETSDFTQFKEEPPPKPTSMQQLDFHQRRRTIASQYRCPKCLKAYLGKMKMIKHIKKYPDHGPLPQKESSNVNFEVWNYLVDITQKCSTAQRGIKFCEELTNLLHNVLLLTSALFKKVEQNKNFVEVDKVLGNAIGLVPGLYTFNDSELYKDVTVLKLITNTDFFKPVDSVDTEKEKAKCAITKQNVRNTKTTAKEDRNGHKKDDAEMNVDDNNVSNKSDDGYFNTTQDNLQKSPPYCGPQIETKVDTDLGSTKHETTQMDSDGLSNKDEQKSNAATNSVENAPKSLEDVYFTARDDLRKSPSYCIPPVGSKIDSHLEDKDETARLDSELLSHHSLMHLSNIRNTVDELMLTSVDPGGTLLDNSTSSDDVMNVDQFVNERFKKITEPDLELATPSLNLDLPSLDLFQFHTT